MKKRFVTLLIMLCLITAFVFAACTPGTVYRITFDADNGTEPVIIKVEGGKKADIPAIPEKEGYIFAGWYANNVEFDFTSSVEQNITLKARWTPIEPAIVEYTVTFVFGNGEDNAEKTIESGATVTQPQTPVYEYHIFQGWFYNGAIYNFAAAVTNDITLTAVWKEDIELLKTDLTAAAKEIYGELIAPYFHYRYTSADYNALTKLLNDLLKAIDGAETLEAMNEEYGKAVADMEAVPTIAELMVSFIANYAEADYYAEDWKALSDIYNAAYQSIVNYEGGAPVPETLYDEAIVAIRKISTIVEDNAAADAQRAGKIQQLNNYVNALNEKNYTADNWTLIQGYLAEGIDAMQNAIGTRALVAAYDNAVALIAAVEIRPAPVFNGEGTAEVPFELATKDDLIKLAEVINAANEAYVAANFKMTGNIDLANVNWTPIGVEGDVIFTGVFDGNGYTIVNLSVTSCNKYSGLFGFIGGTVKNLGVVDANINIALAGNQTAGVIAAYVKAGAISDCYATGSLTILSPGVVTAGGLVGNMYQTTLSNSYADVIVSATQGALPESIKEPIYTPNAPAPTAYAGGLVGIATGCTLSNCFAAGDVTAVASRNYAGKLLANNPSTTITNCYYSTEQTLTGTARVFGTETAAASFKKTDWLKETLLLSAEKWQFVEGYMPFLFNATNLPEPIVPLAFNGQGTAEAPFELATKNDLVTFAQLINAVNAIYIAANYTLCADIDMADTAWTPVGIDGDVIFTGVFDGNGYVIKNLSITTPNNGFSGLFGFIGGTVKNLGVTNVTLNVAVAGNQTAGALTGYMKNGTISDCYATGSVTILSPGVVTAGGLVGNMYQTTLSNSYADVIVSATQGALPESIKEPIYTPNAPAPTAYAGGLVGIATGCTLTNCFAAGDVTAVASRNYAGKLLSNNPSTTITNCYYSTEQTLTGTARVFGTETAAANFKTADWVFNTLLFSANVWAVDEGYPVFKTK
ncbi:MAG: InlB B-repeat-containing protein [Clostridia bacterium]|nr:InlB B-repeat-containing protein [Clostridia bacterium]